MGHTAGILRHRLEGDPKGIFAVVATDMDVTCSGRTVGQVIVKSADGLQGPYLMDFKCVVRLSLVQLRVPVVFPRMGHGLCLS